MKIATSTFDEIPGVVIARKSADKQYIGSPSIAILPNGQYIASHDFFGEDSSEWTQGRTNIYGSSDKGETWHLLAEIYGAFWSNLFLHQQDLYLLGTDKHFGNVVIRKSIDGGATWTTPLNGQSGLILDGKFHTSAVPTVTHNNRIWRTIETTFGADSVLGKRFGAMILSAPVDADLLDAKNWQSSNALAFNQTYLNGNFNGWLEGNAVVNPIGKVCNILRVEDKTTLAEKTALISVSDDGKEAYFNSETDFVPFPGGSKKFTVRYDEITGCYWALSNIIPAELQEKYAGKNPSLIRNTLALISSTDLRNWQIKKTILKHDNELSYAFQYADWLMDSDDIVFLARTAWHDDDSAEDRSRQSNYLTFHRIKNFREC